MSAKLIEKRFEFGTEPFEEWFGRNRDVDILILSGNITLDDYETLCELDIMSAEIGLTTLDMGGCYCEQCKWLYYPINSDSNVKRLVFPSGICIIHTTFEWNDNLLQEVILPDTLCFIGGFSFSYTHINSIQLPNSLVEIAYCAFHATPLTSIFIPNTCICVKAGAFGGCDKLHTISVDDSHPTYKSIDGSLYSKDGKTLIQAVGANSIFRVAEGTKVIEDGAFAYNAMKVLYLPKSIEVIDDSEFEWYDFLELYIYESSQALVNSLKFIEGSVTIHLLS